MKKCLLLPIALLVNSSLYGDGPQVPVTKRTDISPETMAVGQYGCFCDLNGLKVVQIINESEMIVQPYKVVSLANGVVIDENVGQSFWFRGISTKNLTDGQKVGYRSFVVVEGVKKYRTVLGGSRTVFLVRTENNDEQKKREALEAEPINASKPRQKPATQKRGS